MEILTTSEMERADRLTIASGTPGFALMLSAGQAVAEAAMDLVEEGPIVVVAGRGNNGGDGFVVAAELAARGRDVSVILLCERDSLQGDAALAARGWKYPVLPFNPQAIGKPALIIDALFGAGLNRPVKGDPLEMIEAINANGAPVLAVDLPSGINGTSGADSLVGTSGADIIHGLAGADTLRGNGGNDQIDGGEGDDAILGGEGNDTLTGGPGADFFSGGAGSDTNTDFNAGQGDTADGT